MGIHPATSARFRGTNDLDGCRVWQKGLPGRILGVPMRPPSSHRHRFFVYDLPTRRVVYSDYVGHARKSGLNVPHTFSNILGSHMSSLGRYRVGVTYESPTFGTSVRLHGLDKKNSKALDRAIVVHDVQGGIVVSQSRFTALYSIGCFTFFKESYARVLSFMTPGRILIAYR